MCNPLVTIDTGLFTTCQRCRVHLSCTARLTSKVHVVEVMAVSTLKRVIGFQSCPLMFSELSTLSLKLITGINGTKYLTPHLFRCLHLTSNLIGPVMWHMTIWASRSYATSVSEMDSCFELLINIIFHLMTTDTKSFLVGHFKGGVKSPQKITPATKPPKVRNPKL